MDKICLVIDLEGFHIKSRGGFHVRESRYCDWKRHDIGSKSYQAFGYLRDLPMRDRRTVEYVTKHVHGLPYVAKPRENAKPPYELHDDVRALYEKHRTPQRTLIGYKGGHVEKDLLNSLDIPSHDLEEDGCPKFRDMERLVGVWGCGNHQKPSMHHCPKIECVLFVNWMRKESGLSFQIGNKYQPDFVYPL